MKTLKVMSIIGIIWFSLCFICIVSLSASGDYYDAAGWGIWAVLYGIPLSIVGVVQAKRQQNKNVEK